MRLIKAEFRKITSTHLWWILLLVAVAFTAIAFLFNMIGADVELTQGQPPVFEGMSPVEAEQARAAWEARTDHVAIASNLYTSGQYFGLLFTMVLGILLVTNEFFHQTATSTFLVTPRRSRVILAKLATAVLWGIGLWLVTTALVIPAGAIFLGSYDVGPQLGEWGVFRSILLNLLAYAVWAIFGVGVGALIRSQSGAVVTAVVMYLVGTSVAQVAFVLVARKLELEWIEKLQVIVPSIASQLMITGVELPGSPPQWVGAVVLVGYAVLAGGIGTFVLQRRDIS